MGINEKVTVEKMLKAANEAKEVLWQQAFKYAGDYTKSRNVEDFNKGCRTLAGIHKLEIVCDALDDIKTSDLIDMIAESKCITTVDFIVWALAINQLC